MIYKNEIHIRQMLSKFYFSIYLLYTIGLIYSKYADNISNINNLCTFVG